MIIRISIRMRIFESVELFYFISKKILLCHLVAILTSDDKL